MTEYLINIKTIMKCRSPTTRPMGDLQNDGSIGIKRTSVTNWQQKAMVRTKWKELGEVYIQQRIQAGWRSRNGMVFGFLIKKSLNLWTSSRCIYKVCITIYAGFHDCKKLSTALQGLHFDSKFNNSCHLHKPLSCYNVSIIKCFRFIYQFSVEI